MEIHVPKEKSDLEKLPKAEQKIISELMDKKASGKKTNQQVFDELEKSSLSLDGKKEFQRQLAEVANRKTGEDVGEMLEFSENEDFREIMEEYNPSPELTGIIVQILSQDAYKKIIPDKKLLRVAVKALIDVSSRTKRKDEEIFKATLDEEVMRYVEKDKKAA